MWPQGGETAGTNIVQTIANIPPLLLPLSCGMDRDEVMDLIGEFPSYFVHPGVCY
jgi:hypothetical protein